METLYRRCPLCGEFVELARFNRATGACVGCDQSRRSHNSVTPYTESRTAYIRGLALPELRAYVQGQLHAREHGPGVVDELRVICDRLEWVADSLIVAGVDGWQATYGGLRSIRRPGVLH